MRLPLPKTKTRNEKISQFGETWVDLNINELLDRGYEDFIEWEKRKRAYLTETGEWAIAYGGQSLRYFCVQKCRFFKYLIWIFSETNFLIIFHIKLMNVKVFSMRT